jgi:hypothetical protein
MIGIPLDGVVKMVFHEVVSEVGGATLPVDDELALAYAVADPVEAHVNGFGALLVDGVIGDHSLSVWMGVAG